MDEFDDLAAPVGRTTPRTAAGANERRRMTLARAVSRVYRAANDTLRADILRHLLRPLGVLATAAVASGAFARLLRSDAAMSPMIAAEDIARYSSTQIRELALFVQEVHPDTLQLLAEQLPRDAAGVAMLGSAALLLLYRRASRHPAVSPTRAQAPLGAASGAAAGDSLATTPWPSAREP